MSNHVCANDSIFFLFLYFENKNQSHNLIVDVVVCLFELSFLISDVDDWLFTINQKCEQKKNFIKETK